MDLFYHGFPPVPNGTEKEGAQKTTRCTLITHFGTGRVLRAILIPPSWVPFADIEQLQMRPPHWLGSRIQPTIYAFSCQTGRMYRKEKSRARCCNAAHSALLAMGWLSSWPPSRSVSATNFMSTMSPSNPSLNHHRD